MSGLARDEPGSWLGPCRSPRQMSAGPALVIRLNDYAYEVMLGAETGHVAACTCRAREGSMPARCAPQRMMSGFWIALGVDIGRSWCCSSWPTSRPFQSTCTIIVSIGRSTEEADRFRRTARRMCCASSSLVTIPDRAGPTRQALARGAARVRPGRRHRRSESVALQRLGLWFSRSAESYRLKDERKTGESKRSTTRRWLETAAVTPVYRGYSCVACALRRLVAKPKPSSPMARSENVAGSGTAVT